jgi:hypothetical protein
MTLYRPKYLVEYDPTQPPREVVVSSGDMLRAELEQRRLKLDGLAFHLTALWLWAALVRDGVEQRKAAEFIAEPPEFEPVKRPDGQPEEAAVDPTQLESGETDSGVPVSTAPQSSG